MPQPSQAANPKQAGVIEAAVPSPSKTPFYQSINAPRYQRQAIISTIQNSTNHTLICYVSGSSAEIRRDDVVGFVDLLHNVARGADVDLLLHTGGGDMDAAEKFITLVRSRVGTGQLRVVVPDYAKSAGTLMALGADVLLMSDTSELGPIDPQIVLADADGNRIRYSVQSYLDAFQTHAAALQQDPNDVVARLMLSKLDPARLKLFEAAYLRARTFAENQLKFGMFRNGGNYTATAALLIDTKRWLSHGQMISWQDASDASVGLNVEYLEPNSPEWQQYWQLYCLQRLALRDRQKLFESDYASLTLDE